MTVTEEMKVNLELARGYAALAGALRSQAMFEAEVGHTPKTDTRTPADVRAQAHAEGWR